MKSKNIQADYIIVGAGSAGCVLANRLSEDPDVRVVLLEAGTSDYAWDWRIHMPAALAYPMNGTRYSWDYHTEPEPHLDGRSLHCPRGRVLGGSSSINGQVYIRGHALDYDRWAREDPGLKDWDYAHCLPYFQKAVDHPETSPTYHSTEGPLSVERGAGNNPLNQAFLAAAKEAGYPYTEDMNGFQQEGFGPMDRTTQRGHRHSSAQAYLHPVNKRKNLTVLTQAQTLEIRFNGQRACGVTLKHRGRNKAIDAEREVLLCTGPINTPQLLMLSGIGPGDDLRVHNISVKSELPGVGRNLQDHLEIYIQMACKKPVSLYRYYNLFGKAWVGARWLFTRQGIGCSNQFETGGFIHSRPGIEHPDLQYHFFPMAVRYDGRSPNKAHGFQAHVGPMRSKSRGQVKLRSADPHIPPSICFNYMSDEADWQTFRAAIRLTREIFSQTAFQPYAGAEIAPGSDKQSDADLDSYLRQAVESAYHPCGTAQMGTHNNAVVDENCRVYGVEGLRVVDSSIMPSIVSGNLNAPTIMIAEKAADLIAGKPALPPNNAPVFYRSNWQEKQR